MIFAKFKDGGLIHGDCLEAMAKLPAKRIVLVQVQQP